MASCTIIKAGLFTSIQAGSRTGYRAQGIPLSGPMDKYAHSWANRIIGNPEIAAALECTWMGPTTLFHQESTICVFGATVDIVINGHKIPHQNIIHLKGGDQLAFGRIHTGYRFYIAFPDGLETESILGTSSSDTISKLGAPIIQKGEILNFGQNTNSILDMDTVPSRSLYKEIKCYPGPEFDLIEKTSLANLEFEVLPNSNRMAYQLRCSEQILHQYEMISAPVLPGTIQLTPSGQWIVLMRDAQTTGGYPRVLQVSSEDINLLSQHRPGTSINLILEGLNSRAD